MRSFCTECRVIREVGSTMGGYNAFKICGHMKPKANPDIEVPDGELEGWEIMLKVVTNGLGRAAVVFQSNVVAIGPTENNQVIANWLRDYMLED